MPWRNIFFAVNFGAAVLVVAVCIMAIGEEFMDRGSPFGFIGAICFIWPAMAFGVGEWFLQMREVRWLERPLGVACGVVGGLAVFAFIANAAEAVTRGDSVGVTFWIGFGATCFGIAAYGLWCCWLRVRGRTLAEQRGFPVVETSDVRRD